LAITIDHDDKAPLREEVPELLLTVSVGDATDKDLARVTVNPRISLFLVRSLCLGKAHAQRTVATWEMLWINYRSISVSRKLEGCKRIWRLCLVTITLRNNGDLKHMAILRKVIAHLCLADVCWQASHEDLQVLSHGKIVIPVYPSHHLAC